MDTQQIALQLYTVRDHSQRDMLGTLHAVAQIGYRAVEFAGYGGVPVEDIKATLDPLGMQAVSAHVPFERWLGQQQQVIDELHTLGCTYGIVPAVAEERRNSLAQARQLAADLNRCGAACRDAGLRFGYHNHAWEFAPLDGTTLWDVLTTETDPALVALELDVFWAHAGGHDPVTMIRQFGTRVPLLHVKDMAAGDPPTDAPVGDGVLPWSDILAAGAAAGSAWYIVEQDTPRDPLANVAQSFRNLQQMASSPSS